MHGTQCVLQQCGEMVGEFGEEEIWNTFATGEDLFKTFCEQVRLHHQSPTCMIASKFSHHLEWEDCTAEQLKEEVKDEL